MAALLTRATTVIARERPQKGISSANSSQETARDLGRPADRREKESERERAASNRFNGHERLHMTATARRKSEEEEEEKKKGDEK